MAIFGNQTGGAGPGPQTAVSGMRRQERQERENRLGAEAAQAEGDVVTAYNAEEATPEGLLFESFSSPPPSPQVSPLASPISAISPRNAVNDTILQDTEKEDLAMAIFGGTAGEAGTGTQTAVSRLRHLMEREGEAAEDWDVTHGAGATGVTEEGERWAEV